MTKKKKLKISKQDRKLFSEMGKRGGAARAESLTAEQRKEQATAAVRARWDKTEGEK